MLRLRRATQADWARLYAMRNEDVTREMFRSSEFIDVFTHVKWLDKTTQDPDVCLLIAEDSERSGVVGFIRLDIMKPTKKRKDEWAGISIAVDARVRSQGYATQMLDRIIEAGGQWPPIGEAVGCIAGLMANVKANNFASLRAFADAGFTPVEFVEDGIILLQRQL